MEESRARPAGSRPAFPAEIRWLVEVLVALGIASAAVLLGTRYVAKPWTVLGASMEPTLEPGDRVIVDLRCYARRVPHPGEVALLLGPGDVPLVKRVARRPAALPSDAPWVLDPRDLSSERVWVLGDNPGESADSRVFGPVPVGRFLGRVRFRYWPLFRMGRVS
jgi:signal peptidase I